MAISDDLFAIPDVAIRAFEKITRMRVTVHDLGGRLWPFLPPDRFTHVSPLCAAVKAGPANWACFDFGVTRMRKEIGDQPMGRVQVCHAGLVEWVAPVFQENGRLEWVLFAGQRTVGPKLYQLTRDTTPPTESPWRKRTEMPEAVNDDEAQAILEMLRQLAARLRAWLMDVDQQGLARKAAAEEKSVRKVDLASRRTFILDYVFHHHTGPSTLAELSAALGLSESRAGHLVKEACGKTFMALLTEARVRTAAALLRHSNFSVTDVALRSGWGDVSRFHKVFRARMGETPYRYRRQNEGE